jgi:autotransporter-associated beta strand protein
MNRKSRYCARRKFVLITISLLTPVIMAAAPYGSANPFERLSFGNDWRILGDDILFGGADPLRLSPANRTLLLSAPQNSKARKENGTVNAASSNEDSFTFAWFLDSAFASRAAGPAVPNAVMAIKQFDGNGTSNTLWATPANWAPDGVPTSSDDVVFSNAFRSTLQNVQLSGSGNNFPANSITLNLITDQVWGLGASSGTTGATLTLTTGNITRNSTANDSLNTIGAVSGSGIGTGVMTLSTGATGFTITNLDTNGPLQINAIISGATKTVSTIGPGTTIFSGANTYTGATAVTSGTLLINGDQTAATGAVTVKNIGTVLGGTGTIGALVTVDTGGTITGATSGTIGVLTLNNNLTFSFTSGTGGNYLVDLSGAASDLLVLGGSLNLSGSFDQLTLSGTPDGTSSYTLATYTSVTGEFDLTNVPGNYQLIYGDTGLVLAPIPEPTTWIGAALALAAIGLTQRRRFRGLRPRRA